jgi:acetylornithine deacetylase/succinyl-diaminopimelate desuccinylase-like protein
MTDLAAIHLYPAELLQRLIQFDTTNPPGNEAACIGYLDGLLQAAGLETTLLAADNLRPNLITRIKGRGGAPPLLLQGHVDVVTTTGQQWQHPPFAGEVVDDYVWGRGALDMKGGVAMMVAAFLRLKAEAVTPPGDVILALLSDEEAGGNRGAKFLVENHPEQFEGVRHALGEFGAFTLRIAGRTFYPIMVAEKQICWLRLTLRGPAGHGSMPMKGGAMAKLGRLLQRFDQAHLPVHITPVVRQMFEAVAANVTFPTGFLLRQLLKPALTDRLLGLLGDKARVFEPMLRNTTNVTIVRGGEKINVIPGEIQLEVDGRLLPGFGPDDMMAELRPVLQNEAEVELVRYDPGPAEPDMGLFETLAKVLRAADPNGIPMPLLLTGVTDARFFCRLGIQTYGFLPMTLPADFDFIRTIHAADERIPISALSFGSDAIYAVLQQFGE